MSKKVFKVVIMDLVIMTLVLLAVFNKTVESVLGALLFVGGLCMLSIYGIYYVTKPVWLEVHKQKELLNTNEKQNTLNATLFNFIKYYDLHELIGNNTIMHAVRWLVFIITGLLLYLHLYSRFVTWAAKYCVELMDKIISIIK